MSLKQTIFNRVRHNMMVRVLAFPFEVAKREKLLHSYINSEDSKFIKSLKNIHDGKRCFIIGNGPSLTPDDLNKLSENGEITFASNRIYHIYDQTSWRPTYYISMDVDGLLTEFDRIKAGGSYIKFINYKAAKYGRNPENNIWYLYRYGKFHIKNYVVDADEMSEDISHHITSVGTVTANAIEIAIYMGFREIYLLGVDNNYAMKRREDGTVYRDPSVKSSYFAGMKDEKGKEGDGISVQTVHQMNQSYELCKKYAEEKKVKILNATRGGKLELFSRVYFDDLF